MMRKPSLPPGKNEVQMERLGEECETSRAHVALYPAVSAGLGHLIPFLEFARKLVSSHAFSVTLITPTLTLNYPTQANYVSQLLASNPHTINHVEFAEIPVDEQDVGEQFLANIKSSIPPMEQSLKTLQNPNTPVRALICDLFNAECLDVGARMGLPTYVFFTCSAAFLYVFMLMFSGITSEASINIPGLNKPLLQRDFPVLTNGFLHLCSPLRGMRAILVNTFHDLEAHTINALLSSGSAGEVDRLPPVHAVGPVTRSVEEGAVEEEGRGLKMWLDGRANGSVVFASFGTWGMMSREQLTEIALGFEASGVNFVWVVRGIGKIGNATLDFDLSSVLPEGFLGRVEGRGVVISSWAPQVAVLSHPAVGAFVSHCGWNSVLEAVWFGVPIVAWPLYAEQRMNCALVVNELMVGLEVGKGADGLVERTMLGGVVEKVMDGEEGRLVRKNMEELSLKARCAVTEKEGSSFTCLEVAFSGLFRGNEREP